MTSRGRREWIWPVAAISITALLGSNTVYQPRISSQIGLTAWAIDLALVLILSLHPVTARIGVLVAGIFFAVPCFLDRPPLSRGLLACFMAFPFAIAILPFVFMPNAGFRTRMAYFFTWLGTREVKRRARSLDLLALARLIAATGVLAGAVACAKMAPNEGLWLPVRWLAAGIIFLSFGEMVTASHDFLTGLIGISAPALMRSPHLSTSLGEFWAKRWNPATSFLLFRQLCFAPLARHSIALGVFAAFFGSALGHFLLLYMACGLWEISLMFGAFFLVQPLLIAAERRLKVRRWPPAAGRLWTFSALAVVLPLLSEPVLQVADESWGPPDYILPPTLFMLGFVLVVNSFFFVGYLLFGVTERPKPEPR